MKLFVVLIRLIYRRSSRRECIKINIGEKEFETLFNQYKNHIYRLAYTYVNNQADALDVVQETAYQAYISKDKIRDKDKFKSWVLKIAVNKAKDILRKKKTVVLEDISNQNMIKSKDQQTINMFMDDLKNLSYEEKNIIVLKVYFEYTFQMISEEIKEPINSIKTKYYRALEKLRVEDGLI